MRTCLLFLFLYLYYNTKTLTKPYKSTGAKELVNTYSLKVRTITAVLLYLRFLLQKDRRLL